MISTADKTLWNKQREKNFKTSFLSNHFILHKLHLIDIWQSKVGHRLLVLYDWFCGWRPDVFMSQKTFDYMILRTACEKVRLDKIIRIKSTTNIH